jgi:chromosome segregation ATPase
MAAMTQPDPTSLSRLREALETANLTGSADQYADAAAELIEALEHRDQEREAELAALREELHRWRNGDPQDNGVMVHISALRDAVEARNRWRDQAAERGNEVSAAEAQRDALREGRDDNYRAWNVAEEDVTTLTKRLMAVREHAKWIESLPWSDESAFRAVQSRVRSILALCAPSGPDPVPDA